VGYGATSVVYRAKHCINERKNETNVVAIKKVKNLFGSQIYAHRILREIRLLRLLKGHKNVSIESLIDKFLDCETEDHHETS
jgi:serine/threonine protein kinase